MASKKNAAAAMMGGMAVPGLDFGMFLRPQVQLAEAMLKQNIETLDFLKTRFERDRLMLAKLAETQDPAQAMELWAGFWQAMLSDYAGETNKLAASITEIAEQAVRTATEEGEAFSGMAGAAKA